MIKKILGLGIICGAIILGYSFKSNDITKEVLEEKEIVKIIEEEEEIEVVVEKEEGLKIYSLLEFETYSSEGLNIEEYQGNERKEAFKEVMLPTIENVKKEIEHQKEIVQYLSTNKNLTEEETQFLEGLFSEYKVENNNFELLLDRMIVPPTSLILAQAAIESGWGTSRFFKEANNVYGIWSFSSKEPRIPANGNRESGNKVYLKKYETLNESTRNFILILSRLHNYQEFREMLKETNDSLELANYLLDYSELREEYVEKVKSVISYNKFQELD